MKSFSTLHSVTSSFGTSTSSISRRPYFTLRTRVGKIVKQRAAVAENSQPIVRRASMDAAELEHAFSPVFENAKHVEHVRNDNVVTAPIGVQNFSAREHAGEVAEPTLHHFHVNSQREDVEPTDLDLLPPMRRRFRIQVNAGETLQTHSVRFANEIFGERFFDQ